MTLSDEQLLDVLVPWLRSRRWFAAKDARLTDPQVLSRVPLSSGEQVILAVTANGLPQVYQVPVLFADRRHADSLIGRVGHGFVHDGLAHAEVVQALLAAGEQTPISAAVVGEQPLVTRWLRAPDHLGTYHLLSVEQSNTSGIFGDEVFVKFFRLLTPGPNPDIEVQAALSHVGCPNIGEVLGWVAGTWRDLRTGEAVTGDLALVQRYYPGSVDGWHLVHQAEGFGPESYALGAAVARVHQDLVQAFGVRTVAASELAARMAARLALAVQTVPQMQQMAGPLHEVIDRVAGLADVRVQRVHGDLHLGQVLHTDDGWLVLDFEGEPGGPAESRRVFDHPLRDVAAMIRSYAYVAGESGRRWRQAQDQFLAGYTAAGGADPAAHSVLFTAYLVDKAAYEAVYEQRNRPDWVGIPLAGLADLAGLQR
ncbi:MAG: phosphotransferase [Micrococcales bacterium]|nr:phosphotransferase [Micrococcales bacterium]